MLISRNTKATGNILVAYPDPFGNVVVRRCRSKGGAKASATRRGGVVESVVKQVGCKDPNSKKRNLRIVK